ncbi:alpha/beta-type small acid-soluble spore protein [Limnochorda pilosa]|uniref:Spore protein n=1 Tax=Limnochorda pilosa TaxID=1555112 RepID=A0A0K2SMM5_LIMPI|nr:alpha/beta-type small acid-soluble spore protein [Limnochorda pilosa]BAS28366.1 spore protein [Limnochorda pilosa]
MAQGQRRNNRLVPQASNSLDQFKYEVATELGINQEYKTGYWGNIPARECGAVGGHMVRRMIAAAEQSLVDQAATNVRSGFQQAFSQPLSNVTAPATQQGANLNQ